MTNKAISPLCRRMIEDMSIRGLADKTQTGYIRHIKNFSIFFARSPDQATAEDVRRYQLHLKTSGASVNTMAGAVSALKFFFNQTLGCHDIGNLIPTPPGGGDLIWHCHMTAISRRSVVFAQRLSDELIDECAY